MPFLGMGLRLPQLAALGGSAPPSTFVPSAVTFHPEYSLKYPTGTPGTTIPAASPRGVLSVWLRGSAGSLTHPNKTVNMSMNNHWVIGNISNAFPDAESQAGMDMAFDNSGGPNGVFRGNLGDSSGGATAGHVSLSAVSAPAVNSASWQHWLWVFDTNYAAGQKKQVVYRDGVKVTGSATENGSTPAFNVALSTSDWMLNPFIPAYVSAGMFDMSQVFFDTPSDLSTVITGSAGNWDLDPAFVAKFYDTTNHRPVDFGATGSLPLGHQPLIFHDGDETTFATNKGTLNSPSVVGAAAYSSVPFRAPSRPGATEVRPFFNWFNFEILGFTQSSGSRAAVSNFGDPIALNDLMFMVVSFTLNSTDNVDHVPVVTGWTLLDRQHVSSGTRPIDAALYYKVAGVGDVTAAGQEYASAPTISWTLNSGQAFSQASYVFFTYRRSDGTAPTIVDHSSAQSTATNYQAPTVTATGGNQTLVNVFALYSWSDPAAGEYGPPTNAGQQVRFKMALNYGGNPPMITDEPITASGATGVRNAQHSSVTVRSNIGFSVILS